MNGTQQELIQIKEVVNIFKRKAGIIDFGEFSTRFQDYDSNKLHEYSSKHIFDSVVDAINQLSNKGVQFDKGLIVSEVKQAEQEIGTQFPQTYAVFCLSPCL